MNEVKIFENAQFGAIRTAGTSDEPAFCLTDVCNVLGLNPSKVAQRLDGGVLSKYTITDNLGRQQLVNFVNEDGLYDVILDSRKPEAKAFRKWVTSEVLPSIRKSGGYIAAQPEETPEQIMAKALRVADETLKRTQAQLTEANQTIDSQSRQIQMAEGTIEEQQKQIKALAPDAQYTQDVLQSNDTYTLTQVAKDLGFASVYKFTDWAKARNILYYQSRTWLPVAKYSTQRYFATRTHKYIRRDDTIGTDLLTVVTERGRMWLHSLVDAEREQAKESGVYVPDGKSLPIKAVGTIDGEQFVVYLTELNNPCVKAAEIYLMLGYQSAWRLVQAVSKDHKRKMCFASGEAPQWALSYEGVCEAIAKSECINAEAVYKEFESRMKDGDKNRATV